MAKSLCKLKKVLKTDFKKYSSYINSPTHVCDKCGRATNNKNLVCSPSKLK